MLTFLPGQCAGPVPEAWVQSEELLVSVAQLLRRLHAASAGFVPGAHPFPPRPVRQDPAELVCHLDVTPQNVVVRDGRAAGLVDFDLAGPTTAFKDSFNTAMHWVPLRDPADAWPGWEATDPFRRLRIFADAYGWNDEERRRLPAFGIEATSLSYERMQHNARDTRRRLGADVGRRRGRRRSAAAAPGSRPTPDGWSRRLPSAGGRLGAVRPDRLTFRRPVPPR